MICGTQYSAPIEPGSHIHHMWPCELPRGHAGRHGSPSHSISLTRAAEVTTRLRLLRLDAVIADIPCDDCGRTDGSHDPDVEH